MAVKSAANSPYSAMDPFDEETGDLNHAAPALRALFEAHGFSAWLDQPGQPGAQTAQLQALLAAVTAQGGAAGWGSKGFVKGWDPGRQALVDAAARGVPLAVEERGHASA